MQKIVVTGSNGLLGQTLVNLLSTKNYDVYGLSRGQDRNITSSNYTYYNIELTEFSELKKILKEIEPDFIVNTAAMTHVDVCEDNKETCDLINVELVRELAEICTDQKYTSNTYINRLYF